MYPLLNNGNVWLAVEIAFKSRLIQSLPKGDEHFSMRTRLFPGSLFKSPNALPSPKNMFSSVSSFLKVYNCSFPKICFVASPLFEWYIIVYYHLTTISEILFGCDSTSPSINSKSIGNQGTGAISKLTTVSEILFGCDPTSPSINSKSIGNQGTGAISKLVGDEGIGTNVRIHSRHLYKNKNSQVGLNIHVVHFIKFKIFYFCM